LVLCKIKTLRLGGERGMKKEMTSLSKLITSDLICLQAKSRKKDKVFREIAELFFKSGVIKNSDLFEEILRQREKIGSTGIGEGVAVSYGHSRTVKKLSLALVRFKEGIDYQALDNKPVYIIFTLAVPQECDEYLQVLGKIAELIKMKDLKEKLLIAQNKKEILEIFKEFDERYLKETTIVESLLAKRTKTYLMVIVVNQEKYFDDILSALIELGVEDATIVNSEGLKGVLAYEIPIFSGFLKVRPYTRTIFALTEDRNLDLELVQILKDININVLEVANLFTLEVEILKSLPSEE
jgi:mannitol/fructose-specific phosphotransferase system IIA component (Ntr-type)